MNQENMNIENNNQLTAKKWNFYDHESPKKMDNFLALLEKEKEETVK